METLETATPSPDLSWESKHQEALSYIEELKGKGIQCVVPMPYSSDMYGRGKKKGQPYLSYFSNMSVIMSARVYKELGLDEGSFLLVGENTFGKDKKSTTELMTEKFRQLNVVGGEDSQEDFYTPQLNNTPQQIDALSRLQKLDKNPEQSPYLIVAWEFHLQRIKKYAKAYGLNAEFISIETILHAYYPKYREEKFAPIMEEFKRRENDFRVKILGRGKGTGLKLVTRVRGASVNDVEVVKDENGKNKLTFVDTTGKKRMKEVNKKSTKT